MIKKLFSILLIALFLTYNTAFCVAKPRSAKTQLEIREIQTHYFDTKNTTEVYKAAINTLQDNGFIIINIEPEIGYIRAKKDFKGKRTDKARITGYSFLLAYYAACTAFSFGLTAPYMVDPILRMKNELTHKTVIIDSNINIEPVGNKTKMRFMMIEKVLENADGYTFVKSSPRKVVRIYEPILYKEFFNQVEKNIFYEKI